PAAGAAAGRRPPALRPQHPRAAGASYRDHRQAAGPGRSGAARLAAKTRAGGAGQPAGGGGRGRRTEPGQRRGRTAAGASAAAPAGQWRPFPAAPGPDQPGGQRAGLCSARQHRAAVAAGRGRPGRAARARSRPWRAGLRAGAGVRTFLLARTARRPAARLRAWTAVRARGRAAAWWPGPAGQSRRRRRRGRAVAAAGLKPRLHIRFKQDPSGRHVRIRGCAAYPLRSIPMTSFKLLLRFLTIGALFLVLLVPLAMIRGVVTDRQVHRHAAEQRVTESMAGPQRLVGPLRVVPWTAARQVNTTVAGKIELREETVSGYLVQAPTTFHAGGELLPDLRRIGLYDVLGFRWQADVQATFEPLPLPAVEGRRYGTPYLVLGVDEVRGLVGQPVLEVDGTAARVESGTAGLAGSIEGLHAQLAPLADDAALLAGGQVRLHMDLAGTRSLAI